MIKKFAYPLLTVIICWVLSGCSSTPKVEEVTVKRSPIAKIAIVEVTDPATLSVENRGGPLDLLALPGFVVTKKIQQERSAFLASALRNNSLKLGQEMSVALSEKLTAAGYVVEVLKDVKRMPDDPDEVDLEKITTDAEAILVAKFKTVGLYSGQFSTKFIPRLNTEVQLVARKDLSDLYSQSIHYGADARKVAEDQIPSDSKYSYASFGDAVERQSELVESLRDGVSKTAALVASQIRSNGF
jgi:hypothetical protein